MRHKNLNDHGLEIEFELQIKRGLELLTVNEMETTVYCFLGGLTNLIERSEDGLISAADIVRIYRNNIDYALKIKAFKSKEVGVPNAKNDII